MGWFCCWYNTLRKGVISQDDGNEARQNRGKLVRIRSWFEFTFPVLGKGKVLLPNRAPGVSTGLGFIYGLPIGDESVLDLPNTRVAPGGDTGGQGCATDAWTCVGLPMWGCVCMRRTCQGSTRTVRSWGRPPETSADTGWHSCPCWLCPRAVPRCDASSLENAT